MKRLLFIIIVCFSLCVPAQATLTFGAAISDRVNHGSGASLDNLNTVTVLMWIYPTTLSNKRLWDKSVTGAARHRYFALRTTGDLDTAFHRATTNSVARSSGSIVGINAWQFVGVTWNGSTAPKLYRGTLTSAVVELSYTTSTAGTGALDDDNLESVMFGNHVDADTAFQGRIFWVGIHNAVLTLAQIQQQQYRQTPTSTQVLSTYYGYNGVSTQADWSGNGNNGTVTGATVADNAPLAPFVAFNSAPVDRFKLLDFMGAGR